MKRFYDSRNGYPIGALTLGFPWDILKRAMVIPASMSLIMSGTSEDAGLQSI